MENQVNVQNADVEKQARNPFNSPDPMSNNSLVNARRLENVEITKEWIELVGPLRKIPQPGENMRDLQHLKVDYQQHARDWQPVIVQSVSTERQKDFEAFGLRVKIFRSENSVREGRYYYFPQYPEFNFWPVDEGFARAVIGVQAKMFEKNILVDETEVYPGNPGLRRLYRQAVERVRAEMIVDQD